MTRLWIRTIMVERGYSAAELKQFDALTTEQFELWLYHQDKAEWEISGD